MSENENGIGAAVKRREDFRFLTGLGRYTDDINRPGQAFACFVRSPHARAKIKSINTDAAMKAPGVAAIYTGKDMAADKVGGLPCGWQIHSKDGAPMKEPPHMPLAESAVCHVGDQIAVVIAESVREAKDAAELVEVDYEVQTSGCRHKVRAGGQGVGSRGRARQRLLRLGALHPRGRQGGGGRRI